MVFVFLGAGVVLLLVSFLIGSSSPASFQDFISDYYSARCLIRHCDPYDEAAVAGIYRAAHGERPLTDPLDRQIATRYVYPPSALAGMLPFAMLPWVPAHILWMLISTASYLLAALLAWDLSARNAPSLCGLLVGFMLANSEVLVVLCNPSEIVIGLCIVGVWCFLRERFVLVGVLCFAFSLLIKPQVAGLIWLFFLLAGSRYRRRALQTLLVIACLGLPVVLWVWTVSPHWIQELHANLQAFSVRGGLNDPGPSSMDAHELIDLQVIFSRFLDDPNFYNAASYFVFTPLFLFWTYVTLRSRASLTTSYLAIASIALLSLLPIHHHLYDTKLLLLTVPALALLWKRRNRVAWSALALTGATFVMTGDVSQMLLVRLIPTFQTVPGGAADWTLRALHVFPVPLILLTTGVFYLWAYTQAVFHPEMTESSSDANGEEHRLDSQQIDTCFPTGQRHSERSSLKDEAYL